MTGVNGTEEMMGVARNAIGGVAASATLRDCLRSKPSFLKSERCKIMGALFVRKTFELMSEILEVRKCRFYVEQDGKINPDATTPGT